MICELVIVPCEHFKDVDCAFVDSFSFAVKFFLYLFDVFSEYHCVCYFFVCFGNFCFELFCFRYIVIVDCDEKEVPD